jgi:3-phenylpropionate/trans-cinnamate dioxygenase ferredoxin reductase component
VAAGLRDAGFQGQIALIGAETVPPYERPHLSKGYLLGTVPPDRFSLRPLQQYRELGVELMLGERVVEIGIERHVVELASGKTVGWDLLCIATGSDARRLAGHEDALYLRELPQAAVLRSLVDGGRELSIIGAGFIGCEVASAAIQKGCRVHIYEALAQPLLRVLGPELGAYLAAQHRSRGVDLHLNVTAVPEVEGPVLVGVGSAPRLELAEKARLEIDRGVVVDAHGKTSAPDVYAAGDATRFNSLVFQTPIRVEHFQTAQRQGFAVGRVMAGATEPYDEVPWFWSDQYDLNLQYVGAGLPWTDIIIRGEIGQPPFTVFYLDSGRLVAAAGINDHHTIARTRHAMQRRARLTPAQLADPSFDLRRALP